jgi:hypothetical protein
MASNIWLTNAQRLRSFGVVQAHRHFLSILDGIPEPSGDLGDVVATTGA